MNKIISYVLCIALPLLMFSCDKKEEIKVQESNNQTETEFLTKTETDLSVDYYRADEIHETLISNNVMGFYDNRLYTSDTDFETKNEFYKLNDNSHVNIPIDDYHSITDISSFNNDLYITGINKEMNSYIINKISSSNFSNKQTIIRENFISAFEIGKSGHIYVQTFENENIIIKKYDCI